MTIRQHRPPQTQKQTGVQSSHREPHICLCELTGFICLVLNGVVFIDTMIYYFISTSEVGVIISHYNDEEMKDEQAYITFAKSHEEPGLEFRFQGQCCFLNNCLKISKYGELM